MVSGCFYVVYQHYFYFYVQFNILSESCLQNHMSFPSSICRHIANFFFFRNIKLYFNWLPAIFAALTIYSNT